MGRTADLPDQVVGDVFVVLRHFCGVWAGQLAGGFNCCDQWAMGFGLRIFLVGKSWRWCGSAGRAG